MPKIIIHPRIDTKLYNILKTYCCNNNITQQDFIATAIADKLGVKLTNKYMVDDEWYLNHQIEQIDEQITCLQHRKHELLKNRGE